MEPRYRRMLRGMKARQEGEGSLPEVPWHLYILRCGDGSYYTGVTMDIERRVREHQEGRASRYTRTHLPVVLIHKEECGSRSQALSRECAVKTLSRRAKEDLVKGSPPAARKRRRVQ